MTLKELAKTHFDLDLSPEMLMAFEAYAALLIEWNQRMNLTSITEPDAIRVKHFLDSLS
jgi:16S rRNA (guanine527-N7)-methyltransferase